MTQILKNQLTTHNNKSEINNTFFFSHEYCMSIPLALHEMSIGLLIFAS